MSKSEKLVDIAGELKGETKLAFRVFDGTKTEWVPKCYVEMSNDNGIAIFTMPYWLAHDKGFI